MSLYSGGGKRLAKSRGGKRLCAQKRRRAPRVLGLLVLCAALLTGGALCWQRMVPSGAPDSSGSDTNALPEQSPPTQELSEDLPAEAPDDDTFLLSFAGDCTLGVEHTSWGKSGTFPAVVGTDYAYPFAGVRDLFIQDDFTFVNLEGALTDYNVPVEKEYRFRGPPAYGQILLEGGIDAVTLANNHSGDYGKTGLADTRQVLSDLGIAAGGDKETFLYTTDRGLTIGVYTAYHIGKAEVRQAVDDLRAQGAQIIIAAFHMGTEGSYSPTAWQKEICRYAAECGAHIVYNSHPHVLQPMERWGESVILYSMGNFCFGGNRNPSDKDTAVVQIAVQLREDGTAEVTDVTTVPCRVSSRSDRNDYQPTPYEADSKEAARVQSKLDGSFRPPVVQTPEQTPSQGTGQTAEAVPVAAQAGAAAETA